MGPHPGSARVRELAGAVARRQSEQQVGLVASGAAFWLVISAFPTAIAVVSLFGLVVEPEEVAGDLGRLVDAAPASLGSLLGDQLQHVAAADRSGLTIGLAISVAVAVWSASAGIYNLDRAIRDVHGLPRQRYVDARSRSFAEAFAVVLVLGTIALVTAATIAHSHGAVALVLGVPAAIVALVAAITGVYRLALGPTVTLRALVPGATAAAAGMVLVLTGFGLYTSVSTHYTAVYGASGAAVVAMVATYLSVYTVLLGAALNVELVPDPSA